MSVVQWHGVQDAMAAAGAAGLEKREIQATAERLGLDVGQVCVLTCVLSSKNNEKTLLVCYQAEKMERHQAAAGPAGPEKQEIWVVVKRLGLDIGEAWFISCPLCGKGRINTIFERPPGCGRSEGCRGAPRPEHWAGKPKDDASCAILAGEPAEYGHGRPLTSLQIGCSFESTQRLSMTVQAAAQLTLWSLELRYIRDLMHMSLAGSAAGVGASGKGAARVPAHRPGDRASPPA